MAAMLPVLGGMIVPRLSLCYLGTLFGNLATKAGFLSVVLLGFGLASWFLLLAPGERMFRSESRSRNSMRLESPN
jgi:hypothetical protein